MEFEWDERKRLSNIIKHGLDFIDAISVFQDDQAQAYPSSGHFEEKRFVIVGNIHGLIIAVVYTERGAKLRIISARIARREERAKYVR